MCHPYIVLSHSLIILPKSHLINKDISIIYACLNGGYILEVLMNEFLNGLTHK